MISGLNIKTINGNNILGYRNLSISQFTSNYTVVAPVSNTSSAKILVPGLTYPIIAGKKYKIKVIGDLQTTALTTGVSVGFKSTRSATSKGQVELSTVQGSTSVKGTINSINNSSSMPGSFVTSPIVSVISSYHFVVANIFLNCLSNGTFNLYWGSDVAGSASVLNSVTVMIVTVLL